MLCEPNVFLIDGDSAARSGVALSLASVSLPCVTYETAEQYLAEFDSDAPGAVVVDFRLADMNGIELLEHLRAHNHRVPVILISAFGTIPLAVHAMKLGVVEFLEKPIDITSLIAAVRVAIDLDTRNRAAGARRESLRNRLAALTNREMQVIDLITLGRLSKQIAADLRISTRTVEKHRYNIMAKTGAANAPELVRMRLLSSPGPSPELELDEELEWHAPSGCRGPTAASVGPALGSNHSFPPDSNLLRGAPRRPAALSKRQCDR
jgi:FixJ family two-component response regulator